MKVKKRVSKKILFILFGFALFLFIVIIIGTTNEKEASQKMPEDIAWSSLELGKHLPEPTKKRGIINSNSSQHLDIEFTDADFNSYSQYLAMCIDMGYSFEAENTNSSYEAYKDSGHFLAISFNESKSSLSIELDAPQIFGELLWSNSEMAQLLPIPDSSSGDIYTDTKAEFSAKIANITFDEYKDYVKSCSEKGFNVEVNSSEKSYSAKNNAGYQLSIDYTGFNTIKITMLEPKFDIDIELECRKNLMFSTYDVKVYFDNEYETTIPHGDSKSLSFILPNNTYTLKFVSSEDSSITGSITIPVSKNEQFKFRLTCSSYEIAVEQLTGTDLQTATESDSTVANTTESKTTINNNDIQTNTESIYELAFVKIGKLYSLYYMFDTDANRVIYFSSDDTYVEEGSYSGNFEDGVTIYWDHGEYTDTFVYNDNKNTATLIDANGFDWPYEICDISTAQNRLNKITIPEKTGTANNIETTEVATNEMVTKMVDSLTISDLTAVWKSEYSHSESDIVKLGNNETGTITITTSKTDITADDIVMIYDDSLLKITVNNPVYENNRATVTANVVGYSECVTEIAICTASDLETFGENASFLYFTVKKYNSIDGQIVYITPAGEKLHFSKSCAGENAYVTTYIEAKEYDYSHCGNCS